jgi:hypothetical protein
MKQKLYTLFDKNNIKQTLLNMAYILFVGSLLSRLAKQLFSTYSYEDWQISEFLINYQDGFVRRGLIGEILFFFVKNFNINIEWTIKIVCLICFIAVCIFFLIVFLKKGYSLYILPLCFFLGGTILSNYWVRKDNLMLCFFLVTLWIYNKNNLNNLIKIFTINALSIFILLTHEVFAFFSLPVFFILFWSMYQEKGNYKSIIFSFISLLPSILVFFIVLMMHGNQETAQIIWDSWTTFFNQETSQIGKSVNALGWSSVYAIKHHITMNFLYSDLNVFSSLVWALTFPVVYYIATNSLLVFRKNEKIFTSEDRSILSSVLVFQFLCLLPVFIVLSCDYIRIIFYWIASSFAIFLLTPKEKIKKVFPVFFIRFVECINKSLINILSPSKTALVFLMMFIGISYHYCVMIWIYQTTMLYNILLILSQPFIFLKDFLF